ncbi:MAG: dephospho-CoA kinase [Dehalococcoidia bacterium]
MALIIGVTGAIATGKSLVCRTLEELGAIHCNADTLVHQLYAPGTPGFSRVVEAFGPEVVAADGTVDRRVLGGKVFGKPEEMAKLTRAMGDIGATIHAVVDDWRASLPEDASAVLEAVNMIEPGYSAWLDHTWLVVAKPETMLRRLMQRNGLNEIEARQRLSSQRPWIERAPAADFVLHNDGDLASTVGQVKDEFERIRELNQRGDVPVSRYHGWRAAQPARPSRSS